MKYLLLTCLAMCAAVNAAPAANLEDQRRDYQAALAALKKGDIAGYQSRRDRLGDYILLPYLEYAYYRDRVDETPAELLERLIRSHQDAPVSQWLRARWLEALAARNDRDGFLKVYEAIPDREDLECRQLDYRVAAGASWSELDPPLDRLWHHGREQPAPCEDLFRSWRTAGGLKRDRIWNRIDLAMGRGQLELARNLARDYLDREDQVWVDHWIAMHRNPERQLANPGFSLKRPVARMVIIHGVNRVARDDPERAMKIWEGFADRPEITEPDRQQVLHDLGLRAALKQLSVAADWLAMAQPEHPDENFGFWRLHSALRLGRWQQARQYVDGLGVNQLNDNHWRYFRARVLEQTGDRDEARSLYAGLAGERDYYGFLSADRVRSDYHYQHREVGATRAELAGIAVRPAIGMARELYETGDLPAARRQWAWAIRDMSERELQVAAVIANRWGWHDRAILTVSRAGHYDDLDLRFPVIYQELVEDSARAAGIDTPWVYGVVRQESAFIRDARSSAGALGLMQLMPRTGLAVARRLKLNLAGNSAILNVDNNVLLGTSYLRFMLDDHDGNQVLATAAYNAGPHRVKRWLPEQAPLDADLWVETIPFNETRGYVKNVLSYATVYGHRLGNDEMRISERMQQVPARKTAP